MNDHKLSFLVSIVMHYTINDPLCSVSVKVIKAEEFMQNSTFSLSSL